MVFVDLKKKILKNETISSLPVIKPEHINTQIFAKNVPHVELLGTKCAQEA